MHLKFTPHQQPQCAVALGADVRPIVIETASASGSDVPARRPSSRVQLTPAGSFAARDGRPYGMLVTVKGADGQPVQRTVTATAWQLSNSQGYALADRLNARHNPDFYRTDATTAKAKASFGFDYEHQSLNAPTNGQPAPRAGSGSRFEWVYDDGLYITDVTWTPKAAQAILDGEYLYVSPVLFFDPDTGVVVDIFNAALVNTPALQELAGLQVTAAELSARLYEPATQHFLETPPMTLLEQLIAKLGLPAGTTEAAALSAVATQHDKLNAVGTALGVDAAKADAPTITAALSAATNGQAVAVALGAALQLPADALATPATATSAAVALAAKAATAGGADAATQAIAGLSAQVAQLSAANAQRELDEVIATAKGAGKLVPAMEPWARTQSAAALSAFLANAPVIAPTQASAQGLHAANPAAGAAALGADATSIASQLGLASTDLA
jgi:phage I-like protein